MKRTSFLGEKNTVKDVPSVLNIFFPGKCNLQCAYCFVHKDSKNFIDIDEKAIKKVIDIFLNYPSRKKVLSFNGGEPLLEWELLKRLCEYSKMGAMKRSVFLDIVIVTNGTLLSKKNVDFFKKNNISVRISIDGNKQTHDSVRPFKGKNRKSSFDSIMKNIKAIEPGSLRLSASLVFSPLNIDGLLDNIIFLQQKKFEYIDFYPEIYAIWGREDIKKLKEQAKKIEKYYVDIFKKKGFGLFRTSMLDMILNGSDVGKRALCGKIQADSLGNFFACDKVFSLAKEKRTEYSVGNAQAGIDEDRRESMLNFFRREFSRETKLGCQSCPFEKYCACPIGQYLYIQEKRLNNSLFWESFCKVSKILINMNLNIVKKLEYDDLFVKINRF
ncbi:MAG: radical SAM protein [Candidatus Moranbacteria bacterium]|nr:radical SAM protein [Candidatus Moranbacteria bacterium]